MTNLDALARGTVAKWFEDEVPDTHEALIELILGNLRQVRREALKEAADCVQRAREDGETDHRQMLAWIRGLEGA